jgi:ADP-heptose:LPS heptosyltransferase
MEIENIIKKKENDLLKEPTNILKLRELGDLYKNNNDVNNTLKYYLKYTEHHVDPYILHEIGLCYFSFGKNITALKYFLIILKFTTTIPDLYNNIATCYVNLKKYSYALPYLNKSYELLKNDTICNMLGNLYFYMKQYDNSIKYYSMIENKDKLKTYYQLSFSYLAKKDFIVGFQYYEARLLHNDINPQSKKIQRVDIPMIKDWSGKEPCNNLLIVYEQGIGDNILYYRFVIELAKKYPSMKITYFCKDTVSHFLHTYDNIEIVDNLNLPIFDYKLYIMSIPNVLKLSFIPPCPVNYIKINPEKNNYWKDKIKKFTKFKIGFFYKGLLKSFIEKNIPLTSFKALSNMNIDLICLHKQEEIQNDINKCTFKDKIHFFDIDKEKAFEDTIAILHNIDLVITIDSSIVHLAGAMGVKTWLLLGNGSDWRWFDNENECLWYENVELLRVKEEIKLKNIMTRVEEKLKTLI